MLHAVILFSVNALLKYVGVKRYISFKCTGVSGLHWHHMDQSLYVLEGKKHLLSYVSRDFHETVSE